MTALRSLLFNVVFFTWTGLLCILALPLLALPSAILVRCGRFWALGNVFLLRRLVGLRYEIKGRKNYRGGGVVYALKHQSALDTLLLPLLVKDPMIILKRELLWVPVFGWLLLKTGQIAVDRAGKSAALKKMLREAKAGAAAGRPIIIFPEGTRVPPGERRPYQPGVAALYGQLGVPVVPVALNSGLFWPRRSFLKKPGVATVEFLPAIEPGLSRKQFLAKLEHRMEEACNRLLAKAKSS